jgi:hypothetical protein
MGRQPIYIIYTIVSCGMNGLVTWPSPLSPADYDFGEWRLRASHEETDVYCTRVRGYLKKENSLDGAILLLVHRVATGIDRGLNAVIKGTYSSKVSPFSVRNSSL